ncbi:MAG TPA: phosphatase PAP2 family protein [Planctomycetota bacterium]|nr:phosphatase PAP2 family protein [Planctomycetota bacterium]
MNRKTVAFLALALACAACSGPERYQRHFDTSVWSHGLQRHAEDPAQWVPEVGLAALTAGLIFVDADFTEDSQHQYLTGGDTFSGDVVSTVLGFTPLLVGAVEWAQGDAGRSFEIASEALLLTSGATELLKRTTNRRRPGNSASRDSFPSGHTSFAAAGATLLAREIEAGTGSRLGYLFFVPALYVAVDRVEGQRHWATDVAAGVALGMFLTHWVYNAHYPRESASDRTIFSRPKTFDWSLAPVITDDGFALAWKVSI